jgi:hypothetical protein
VSVTQAQALSAGIIAGFFLLMEYNLVLQAQAAFLMYLCGSSLFKWACNLVGMIFLGLIISFSCGSIFLRQYERPSLVVRERCVSLFTLGVDVSFFFVFSFFVFLCCMLGGWYQIWSMSNVVRVACALRVISFLFCFFMVFC